LIDSIDSEESQVEKPNLSQELPLGNSRPNQEQPENFSFSQVEDHQLQVRFSENANNGD